VTHELARVASFLPRRRRYDSTNPSDLNASLGNADFMLQNTHMTDSFSVEVYHKVNILRPPAEIEIVRLEDVFAPAEKFFLFSVR